MFQGSIPPRPLPAGRGWGYPMQDAVPSVVVMAVRMVMMILMMVRHVSFDFIVKKFRS